ncbi:hypothetical protein EDB19DRAFT_1824044 [Suillus lakei]|nr:hypothetical protein EDB19DRAFT_1824044 [Suillus lakei]
MNLAATTSCNEVTVPRLTPPTTPLQYPYITIPPDSSWCYDSCGSPSPPPSSSPPSSPPSLSSVHQSSPPSSPKSIKISDADEHSDIFPLTPNSKCSSGAHHTANPPPGVHSPADSNHYHPYHWPPLFEEKHFFERFSRYIDDKEPPQAINCKVMDVYLQHIEGMSPHTFRCAVHYKEAHCLLPLWMWNILLQLVVTICPPGLLHFKLSMMQPATGDGKVPSSNNDSNDPNSNTSPTTMMKLAAVIIWTPTSIHMFFYTTTLTHPSLTRTYIYHDGLPPSLFGHSYPPMPLHHGMDRAGIQQSDVDPIPSSSLPLMQPNLSDYHPTFSPPVMSMDGTVTLLSTAEDPTMTAQTSSQVGPSRMTRRLPKKHRNDPFIHFSPAPPPWGVNKRNPKCSVLNEAPTHSKSIVTRSPIQSTTGSTLAATAAALPPMVYDESNSVHQQIVKATEQSILNSAVNICSMLLNLDITQLVCELLTKAVISCCHNQTAYHSAIQGWTQEWRVKDLVDDHTSPLKFIFRKDEETDKWWPFEHEVIWDVALGVILELKLQPHIKNLNNIFCTAAAAIYCALLELRSRKMVDIVFSAVSYKNMYD